MSWNKERKGIYIWLGVVSFIVMCMGIIDVSRRNDKRIRDLRGEVEDLNINKDHTHRYYDGRVNEYVEKPKN